MKKLIASILTIILLFSMNLSYAFAGAGATDSNGHRDDVGEVELNAPPKMVYRSTNDINFSFNNNIVFNL